MLDNNLNKELETVKINLYEIMKAYKNNNLNNFYDGNIEIIEYKDSDNDKKIIVNIQANNKNYIIINDDSDCLYPVVDIKLFGDKNGDLIVINNTYNYCGANRCGAGNGKVFLSGVGVCYNDKGTAIRSGEGHGNAIRSGCDGGSAYRWGDGNGHAIKLGNGNGDARRTDEGHGHAINSGSGDGSAFREDDGNGHAIRAGPGEGNANRYGKGKGNALRFGTGEGDVDRHGQGDGHALRIGNGCGSASRYGSGNGNVFRLGSGNGYAQHNGDGYGHTMRSGSGDGGAESYNQNKDIILKKGIILKLGKGKKSSTIIR